MNEIELNCAIKMIVNCEFPKRITLDRFEILFHDKFIYPFSHSMMKYNYILKFIPTYEYLYVEKHFSQLNTTSKYLQQSLGLQQFHILKQWFLNFYDGF